MQMSTNKRSADHRADKLINLFRQISQFCDLPQIMGSELVGQPLQRTIVSYLSPELDLMIALPIPQMKSERPSVAISWE